MSDVEIEFVSIDKDNWKQFIAIDVHEDQKQYVASNLHSMAEAQFYEGSEFYGLAVDGENVGFTLLFHSVDEPHMGYIVRYMIAAEHQGRGYGIAGLHKIIQYFKDLGKTEVSLTVIPENEGARNVYEKIGFENTKEIIEGELKYRYLL